MWPDLGLKGKLKSQKGRQRAVRAGKGTVFSHHGEGGSNYGRVNIRPRLDTVAQDMDVKSSLAVSRLPPVLPLPASHRLRESLQIHKLFNHCCIPDIDADDKAFFTGKKGEVAKGLGVVR